MLLVLTFFLIFGWKINSWFDISAMLGFALVIYQLIRKDLRNQMKLTIPIASLIVLVLYSTTVVLLTGITDLQPILRAGRALFILLAGYSLFSIYKIKYNNPSETITVHIFLCLVFHSLIMLAMYCSDTFLNFIYSFTDVFSIANKSNQISEGFRICGLTYSLSQTSVLQLFGVILLPFVYSVSKDTKSKIFTVLSFIPLIISIIISGRSGLFIGLIYLLITLLYLLYKKPISLKEISERKSSILKWLTIGILSIIIIINILPQKFINYSLFYAQEIFQVFINKSVTVGNLREMFILPDNIITTIFGCGNYGRTEAFYLPSDIGYVKSIFAIGIIGTIFMIIPFIYGIYTALKFRNKLSATIILILLASLILNFKELSLLTRNQWTIQAILLAALNYFNDSKKVEN